MTEQPPRTKPYARPDGGRGGLRMVNAGEGKGKTAAAIGLAVRALGRGKSVRFFQFMKVGVARFGEHRALERLGLELEGLGDGFSWKSRDLERSAELARAGWQRASEAIQSGEHFLVVLDEMTYPLIYGWLALDPVVAVLAARPAAGHVALTGRRCPQELVESAATATEALLVQ